MPTERDLLVSALRHLAGSSYDNSPPYDPGSLDCVRFTYAVLRDLWPAVVPQYHAQIHLTDPAQPFSPVAAIDSAGIGRGLAPLPGEPAPRPLPGFWHLCQGWKTLSPLNRGHGWLWYEPEAPLLGSSLIVQSTNARYPWVLPMSWDDQVAKYPHTQIAILHLD